uniref:Uncharacterized protein n=1 Tax=Amphimedon queenslandica TaxID=400682 RepID=A0A1X7U7F7_AMPQE
SVVPPPRGAAWDHLWLLLLVMLRALHTRRKITILTVQAEIKMKCQVD